ncbi:MAG: CPBP family intramembrane metalloprotease [Anaerolineaceae bacterium]|nr:CPBP family intramembrane metalloprotease [Anaerolineaceae bacterium]
MNVSTTDFSNSRAKLQERLQAGKITWKWPVIIVFARLFFAVFAQTIVAGLYMLKGNSNPWQAAAPWWIVYGTLIDIGCFVLLARLVRREGIRLYDLISFQRQRLGRDLLLGLGFIPLYIILAVAGGIIGGILIYGASPAPAIMVPLPFWGSLYSLIAWPLIWAFAEEMIYQGYALPRLEVLSGHTWLAVIIVGFGWAIQHSALPLMADWRFAVYRFGSSLLIGIVLPIIYLRTRRLLPFIFAHWAANFVSVLMTVVLPLITP